jgi:hypothetical protein
MLISDLREHCVKVSAELLNRKQPKDFLLNVSVPAAIILFVSFIRTSLFDDGITSAGGTRITS